MKVHHLPWCHKKDRGGTKWWHYDIRQSTMVTLDEKSNRLLVVGGASSKLKADGKGEGANMDKILELTSIHSTWREIPYPAKSFRLGHQSIPLTKDQLNIICG